MDEVEVFMRKFGDEQSALLDRYERLSVELKINQVMLKRSLSEPIHQNRYRAAAAPVLLDAQGIDAAAGPQQPGLASKKKKGGSGFQKVLKKMIKPFIGRMRGGKKKEAANGEFDPKFWKTFSRTVRL